MNAFSCAVHVGFMRRCQSGGVKAWHWLNCGLWPLVLGAAAPVPLRIDREQSRIEIDVTATLGSFVGELADYEAQVEVDPESRRVQAAELVFRFADVVTGEDRRDRHMHAWQDTVHFPEGRFELQDLRIGAGGRVTASGRLTLHGQTHGLSFPITILTENRTVVIDGEAPVDVERWGLPAIRNFLIFRVNPVVMVRFHLQGEAPHA